MKSETLAQRKNRARQQLAAMPFAAKLAALVNLQRIARDMTLASGRPFRGIVWGTRQQKLSRRYAARRAGRGCHGGAGVGGCRAATGPFIMPSRPSRTIHPASRAGQA